MNFVDVYKKWTLQNFEIALYVYIYIERDRIISAVYSVIEDVGFRVYEGQIHAHQYVSGL